MNLKSVQGLFHLIHTEKIFIVHSALEFDLWYMCKSQTIWKLQTNQLKILKY